MSNSRSFRLFLACAAVLVLGIPAVAQDQQTTTTPTAQTATATGHVNAGQKQKLSGVIIQRNIDNLTVRDYKGTEYNVSLNSSTKITERKSNPFRGAKKYGATDLARGLAVEVEGRGNQAGALVADQIKFSVISY